MVDQIILGTVACALRDVLLSAGLAFALGKLLGITGMFVGLAAASARAYVLLMEIVTARYDFVNARPSPWSHRLGMCIYNRWT